MIKEIRTHVDVSNKEMNIYMQTIHDQIENFKGNVYLQMEQL